jgi:hypothetical protein
MAKTHVNDFLQKPWLLYAKKVESITGTTPLAISDFKNGLYTIRGETVSLERMWQRDINRVENWTYGDEYDPASVIPGLGLSSSGYSYVINSPSATRELVRGLDLHNGITIIADYILTEGHYSNTPNITIEVGDRILLNNSGIVHQGSHHIDPYFSKDGDTTWLPQFNNPSPKDRVKSAMTFSPDSIAHSINGQAPNVYNGSFNKFGYYSRLWVHCLIASHQASYQELSTSTLEKLVFLVPQPLADLQTLSIRES